MTVRDAEEALVNDAALVAVTEQAYVTPPNNPTTVKGDPDPVATRVTWPVAEQVAL